MPPIAVELAGGVGEMGHHHLLLDLGADSFAVDCGSRFPGPADPGIDRIGPPLDAAKRRFAEGRLRGLVLTHGHLDHIGCVDALLESIPELPVYANPWTLGRLARRLELDRRPPLRRPVVIEPGEPVAVGGATLRWHAVTHSIPGACSVSFESASGTVVHSGDFRVQPEPLLGPPCDVAGLRALGDRGVDLALVDSTGAGRAGRTRAEADIVPALVAAAADCSGRVVVTVFSSHLERVLACVLAAGELGRTAAVYGRSLVTTVADGRAAGLLPLKAGALVDVEEVVGRPRNQQLIIVTGTQGEPRAPLARMARAQDSRVRVEPGDRVLWSARVIPGNERAVNGVVSGLIRQGAGQTATVVPQARSGERLLLNPERGEARVEAGDGGGTWATVGRSRWAMTDPAIAERRRAAREGAAIATVERVDGQATRLASVATLGVFDEPRRAAGERAVAAALAAGLPQAWDDEELRLWLRRAVREATGLRPHCRVVSADPVVVESDQD